MTDPESISSERSLPQWMRMRPDLKYDLDGTSFSPPPHEDSFFYIRYPIGESDRDRKLSNMKSISDAISDIDTKSLTSKAAAADTKAPAASKNDFTKHTEPCKMFINRSKEDSTAPSPPFVGVKNQKPFGIDDGFKGPGAACGSSIVKVARQMVSGKSLGRGFTVANFNTDIGQHPDSLEIEPDTEDLMSHPRYSMRRGSKSLPASPLGSPKSMRKAQPNPYFTGQFSAANSTATAVPGPNAVETQSRSGWFLSSLLGISREASSSQSSVVSNISEEAEEALEIPLGKGSSILNPKVLKAKPSELREMNFWTPTSM